MDNVSVITLFTLSGLDYTAEQKLTLFFLALLWYLMILFVNVSLIAIIIVDKNLHEPMYIFLCNLCFSVLYGTAGFYPKFLLDLLSSHVVSYAGCMLQGYVIHSATCGDLSILALMAYDRYVAICRPLVYHTVMTKRRITVLVFLSWFLPLYCMSMNSVTLLGSRLCGSRIDKLYCVNWMIVQLACTAPVANTAVAYFNILLYFGHAVFIFGSYMYIVKTCFVFKESKGKFMQTCVPHLVSVVTFSVALLLDILYMRFGLSDLPKSAQNFMSIEFLVIPPFINPLIYGFKLNKIRYKIQSLFPVYRSKGACEEKVWKLSAVLHISSRNNLNK